MITKSKKIVLIIIAGFESALQIQIKYQAQCIIPLSLIHILFKADARYEMAYQRRLSRHKAQYSLDCEDGIEYSACLHEPTPQELLERMELFIRLWNALNSLPEVQGRRVDACVILGKTYSEVAEAEGVDESAVRRAVERGLENMKKYLKKSR